MSPSLLASIAAVVVVGTKPNTYSERWLCDVWAGAQCHATSCAADGKERCKAAALQCASTSRTVRASEDRAAKMSACARALLSQACGSPQPQECAGLTSS